MKTLNRRPVAVMNVKKLIVAVLGLAAALAAQPVAQAGVEKIV